MKVFSDVEKGLLPSTTLFNLKSRSLQGAFLIILLVFLTLSLSSLHHARRVGDSVLEHYKDKISKVTGIESKGPSMARRLYPAELMERPLATDLASIPKYFHQSWMNETLPAKFNEWSTSCRKAHPDWEWILWTDADNFNMIMEYAPWFMDTYEFLRSEIYRADTARNVYMHVFGGVYADLDTECVLSYDSMFQNYNVSTLKYTKTSSNNHVVIATDNNKIQKLSPKKQSSKSSQGMTHHTNSKPKAERKAFLGRMGTDNDFGGSIPNAWMASTPGHPFWLLPLQTVEELLTQPGIFPEEMTGPNALKQQLWVYDNKYTGGKGIGGKRLDQHYAKSGWRHLYNVTEQDAAPHSLTVLPPHEVYPYSWWRDGDMFRAACDSSAETFDAKKCKLLLGLEHWGSHSITYWSHSWSESGHWDEHIESLSKSNDQDIPSESDKVEGDEKEVDDKKGDASEANRQAEEKKKEQEDQEELEKLSIGMSQRRSAR